MFPMGGVSRARNIAIDEARGDWIMFIDSDDLVKPDYVEALLSAGLSTGVDMVTCRHMGGKYFTIDEFLTYETCEEPSFRVVKLEDYRYTNQFHHDIIWAGLYRATLIKGHYFRSDLYVGEDTFYFAELLKATRKMAFVDEIYYYYRFRMDSLAHMKYNRRLATEVTSWEEVCKVFSDENKDFQNECKVALGIRCRKNIAKALMAKYSDKGLIKELHSKMAKYESNILLSKEISLKQKIRYSLFLLSPTIYCKLRRTA